jgi:hypothetical protein
MVNQTNERTNTIAMNLSLSELKKRGFVTDTHDDYTLVYPARNKYEWEPDELCYRSAVLDKAGNVISLGWPKFFNQGEYPHPDAVIADELVAGTAIITHKHDGSLIIRSVLPDGRVLLRTRGSFDGAKFGVFAEAVAREKYPILLDPTFFPDGSLLFEYVGTENQIVVRYGGEDDLIFLGAVTHQPVCYFAWSELQAFAATHNLNLTETYHWATNGVASVLEQVRDWNTAEGVVIRASDGQTLLKVKSAWYFAQHALRSHLTYKSICRFAIDGAILDEAILMQKLQEVGWDYETATVAREHFAKYLEACVEVGQMREKFVAFYADFCAEPTEYADEKARRKAYASRVFAPDTNPEIRQGSGYAFLLYDGKEAELIAKLQRQFVLQGGN